MYPISHISGQSLPGSSSPKTNVNDFAAQNIGNALYRLQNMKSNDATNAMLNDFANKIPYDELIKQAMKRIEHEDHSEVKSFNEEHQVFRSFGKNIQFEPFGGKLFCTVTQSKCDMQNFYIFERSDGSYEVAFGVSREDIAKDIKNKFPFFPTSNGEPSRKIVNYHKLSEKLNARSKDDQEKIVKLTNLVEVAKELCKPAEPETYVAESGTYIKDNIGLVSSEIKKVLEENLDEFKKFDSTAFILGPLQDLDMVMFKVGKINFIYSDNRCNEGAMCPKNRAELTRDLKIDVSAFALFHLSTMVSSINETTITLNNNQILNTKSYIEDNGESITINIEKFKQDLEKFLTDSTDFWGLSQDERRVYRSLGNLPSITFNGFNSNG
tara:strand:+ start:66 stop:1211 length:1146 start_codon:yes stop_codon:yes gene_type:complete